MKNKKHYRDVNYILYFISVLIIILFTLSHYSIILHPKKNNMPPCSKLTSLGMTFINGIIIIFKILSF